MKAFIIATALLAVCAAPQANAQARAVTISEQEYELPIDVSTAKLKLSQANYASPTVKVLIPDLAAFTILDHRNTGEGAPCLATYGTLDPEDVIQHRPAIERVKVKITLKKRADLDEAARTCSMALIEEITTTIRGFEFAHYRQKDLGQRHPDDCR